VVDRERANRAETRQWLALWEPHLAQAYGVEPRLPDLAADLPRLPHPNTQRAVDRRLAEVQLWLAAGAAARQRQQQRRPHALPSLCRLARLLQLAFDLKKMVLGLDSINPLPDQITYDYELTDLKRAYGHLFEPASVTATTSPSAAGAAGVLVSRSPLPAAAQTTASPTPPGAVAGMVSSDPPPHPDRCDAWSRLARQLRRRKT